MRTTEKSLDNVALLYRYIESWIDCEESQGKLPYGGVRGDD
jgi:hypothetical protein